MQLHARGKTAHTDFRIETEPGGDLIGYTIMNQVEGAIDKPIVTVDQAKKYLEDDRNWKYNPLTGNFQYKKTEQGIRKISVQTALKDIGPNSWLNINGIIPKGNVGATKNYPGVIVIAAQGKIEYGFREPYFHEYYVHNKNWPRGGTRLVFRMLENTPDSKFIDIRKMLCTYGLDGYNFSNSIEYNNNGRMVSDELRGHPKAPAYYINNKIDGRYFLWDLGYFEIPWEFTITRDGGYLCKLLPFEEEPGKDSFVWLTIEPNTLEPYILSSRAEEKKKFPPIGVSALPEAIKDQIPTEFKYWNCSSIEKMQVRLSSLRNAIKSKDIVLDYSEKIFKKHIILNKFNITTDKSKKVEYVLKKRFWRGPIDVRFGVPIVFFNLYVKKFNGKWYHFVLMENPMLINSFAGFREYDTIDRDVYFEGSLASEYGLSLNKELEVQVQILTKGQLFLKEVSESTWHLEFESGDLKKRSFKAIKDVGIWKFKINDN
jgi:hypothetical protein